MKNRILEKLAIFCDYIELGVLCALCAIPLVTFFTSLSAALYTKKKCFDEGRAGIIGTFLMYFRKNAGKEIIIEMIFLVYIVLGCIEVIAADQLLLDGKIHTVFAAVRWLWFLPGIMIFPWIVTYESGFNDTIAEVYKKSLLLSVAHLGESVIMTLGIGFLAIVIRYFCALIIFIPIPAIILLSHFTEPVYQKLIEKSETDSADNK